MGTPPFLCASIQRCRSAGEYSTLRLILTQGMSPRGEVSDHSVFSQIDKALAASRAFSNSLGGRVVGSLFISHPLSRPAASSGRRSLPASHSGRPWAIIGPPVSALAVTSGEQCRGVSAGGRPVLLPSRVPSRSLRILRVCENRKGSSPIPQRIFNRRCAYRVHSVAIQALRPRILRQEIPNLMGLSGEKGLESQGMPICGRGRGYAAGHVPYVNRARHPQRSTTRLNQGDGADVDGA